VMLGALAAFSTVPGRIAEAREVRRIRSPGLSTDQLGESLNKFRSLHKDAKCIVRPVEWSDERSFKTTWLLWVDCSLEKRVAFEGKTLLAEVDPIRPFWVFASFYKKRLVELTYTLSTESMDALLPIFDRRYGESIRTTYNRTGFVDSAEWSDREASLDVELVPISLAIADRDFLRIGGGLSINAVRIRIRLKRMPPSDP
jgi:hypothetical protein